MAPREAYVRVVKKVDGFEVIAGLELRDDDDWLAMRLALSEEMSRAVEYTERYLDRNDWAEYALVVETRISAHWPDRAYFIEVGKDDDSWIQLFQPYGVPRCDS